MPILFSVLKLWPTGAFPFKRLKEIYLLRVSGTKFWQPWSSFFRFAQQLEETRLCVEIETKKWKQNYLTASFSPGWLLTGTILPTPRRILPPQAVIWLERPVWSSKPGTRDDVMISMDVLSGGYGPDFLILATYRGLGKLREGNGFQEWVSGRILFYRNRARALYAVGERGAHVQASLAIRLNTGTPAKANTVVGTILRCNQYWPDLQAALVAV